MTGRMHLPSEAGVFRDGYALLERFLDSADVSMLRNCSGRPHGDELTAPARLREPRSVRIT
jgi:hypothetical protein